MITHHLVDVRHRGTPTCNSVAPDRAMNRAISTLAESQKVAGIVVIEPAHAVDFIAEHAGIVGKASVARKQGTQTVYSAGTSAPA